MAHQNRMVLTRTASGPKLVSFVSPLANEDIIFNQRPNGVAATNGKGNSVGIFRNVSLDEVAAEISLIIDDWESFGE